MPIMLFRIDELAQTSSDDFLEITHIIEIMGHHSYIISIIKKASLSMLYYPFSYHSMNNNYFLIILFMILFGIQFLTRDVALYLSTSYQILRNLCGRIV